ncbi:MAG: heme-dependent oxidative N-demethylase family protein [Cyclobacteriaceae bacterium]
MSLFNELKSPARYLPFLNGKYNTAPGLHKLGTDFGNGQADSHIFQLDQQWPTYRKNKAQCLAEDLQKYFCHDRQHLPALKHTCSFIIQHLLAKHPAYFRLETKERLTYLFSALSNERLMYDPFSAKEENYLQLFHQLALQFQEDLAIWQLSDEDDWISCIHLCAPNHWSPQDKVGRSFSLVHEPVAGMEKMRERYLPMLRSLLKGGTFVRFAWGLATDKQLNHHPLPPAGKDPLSWQGRSFDPDRGELYVRVERQTLSGFPEVQAALFTIRTYFENVRELNKDEKKALAESLLSMSAESLRYKGLDKSLTEILTFMK